MLAAKGGLDVEGTRRLYPRVAEVPFDSDYKLMATFHRMQDNGRNVVRCLVKGAPDVLLARSAAARGATARRSRSSSAATACSPRTTASPKRDSRARRGLARHRPRRLRPWGRASGRSARPQLFALIGIVDPPRKEARDAIARCKEAGIRVRMITGDHVTTAASIGAQLGIEGEAFSGTEFAALSDTELDQRLDGLGVVARVAPEDKCASSNFSSAKATSWR